MSFREPEYKKTAVLISGQQRSFAQVYLNLRWYVLRKLKNPVFFVSCAKDEYSITADRLKNDFTDVSIEVIEQPTLPEPDFKLCAHAGYTPTPNSQAVVQSILRQIWHYNRVWDFMRETRDPDEFQGFVRLRPDLHFHRFDYPGHPFPNQFFGCPWGTYSGVNDRFSIMGRWAAQAYFQAHNQLPALLEAGCPLHPETIQGAVLEAAGCDIRNTMIADFSCVRLPKYNPGTGQVEQQWVQPVYTNIEHAAMRLH